MINFVKMVKYSLELALAISATSVLVTYLYLMISIFGQGERQMDTGVHCAVCNAEVDSDWEIIADQIVCVRCVGVWTDEELEEKFQE